MQPMPPAPPATILVIEDEAPIRKLAVANLVARGYGTVEAASAEEGLVQIQQYPVALVLLDIKLPGLPGWSFLDASAALPPVPVIIMTASVGDARRNAHKYPNVVNILVKPFDAHVLVEAVKQALDRGASQIRG